jgi:hypothetical protein
MLDMASDPGYEYQKNATQPIRRRSLLMHQQTRLGASQQEIPCDRPKELLKQVFRNAHRHQHVGHVHDLSNLEVSG